MATVDLNKCFPPGSDGTRKPLPKQALFMQKALDPKGPKYTAYVGGVGSGKTIVGCLTVLTWAVMYPGDYLIARQFMPELRVTTLKTFLELCPKELLKEYRVADAIVRVRAVGGQVSTIMFRQLEEPDKLRSLNLSGFYIDEASQCSGGAFELLQGRLRGKGLIKGIITSNPNGHDWLYNWWVKQEMHKTPEAKAKYCLIKAPSTENTHLPDGYVQGMLETWSEDKIKREIYGDFDSFSGQVYPEFKRDLHVIKPFVIPKEWTRVVGADHGYRNAAAWEWGAVDYDGNIYVYREFYRKEWLIEEICKLGKGGEPSVVQLSRGEKLDAVFIDPSTTARRAQTGFSDYDHYIENLPEGFPLHMAKNDVKPGIERVKQYLKVNPRTGKPRLFIFDTCVNLLEEIAQYRYKENLPNEQGKKSDDETPVKANDHCVDALRYLIMSRPESKEQEDNIWENEKYSTLEGSLRRHIKSIKSPSTGGDPFGV